jgi:integrase
MPTSYDVRIWKIRTYKGKRDTTYTVRWNVDHQEKSHPPFATFALADSFRSGLRQAANRREPFDADSGLPASMLKKPAATTTWYAFAVGLADAKWKRSAAHSRKNRAEALMTATVALLRKQPDRFTPLQVRTALRRWAFNTERRDEAPRDVTAILRWVERTSHTLDALSDPQVARLVTDAIAANLDGTPAAASTLRRRRSILYNAGQYGVETGVFDANPFDWSDKGTSRSARAIDKRCLINPGQASALLAHIKAGKWGGTRLHAFFATLYYAGLRPEEAAALTVRDVSLPQRGWGEILVHTARPEAGSLWTGNGTPYETRHLKARAKSDTRPVPAHPTLVAILRDYIANPGSPRHPQPVLDPADRLFSGAHGGELSGEVYRRAWAKARLKVLSPEEHASPLGRRVYDLRHTCLTTWLNSGVAPARVAAWAGNSVPILLAIYVNCVTGDEDEMKRRVENTLPHT